MQLMVFSHCFSQTTNHGFSMKTIISLLALIVIVYQKPAPRIGQSVKPYSIIWPDTKGVGWDKDKKLKNKKRIGHCPECQTIFNHLTRDTKGVSWDKKSLNYVQSFQQRGRFKIETVRCSVTRSTNLVSQWSALQCFPQLCGAGECLVLSVACRPAVTFLTAHHLTAIAAVTVCAAVSSLYSSTAADIMSLA